MLCEKRAEYYDFCRVSSTVDILVHIPEINMWRTSGGFLKFSNYVPAGYR